MSRDHSDPSKDQREATTEDKAGQVTRHESPGMLGTATAAYGRGAIQRKIAERAAKRSAAPSDGAAGGGAVLPGPVQEKMEGSFGADFSDVRVHQGAQADNLGARAFTRGSDVHFAPGEYDPSSSGGQALIGHELTHVVQQRAGRVATQGKDGPINNDPSLEGEADRMGAAAARGEPVQVAGSSAGLQRKGAEDAPIQCEKKGAVPAPADPHAHAPAAAHQAPAPAQAAPAAAAAVAPQLPVKAGMSLISGVRARQAAQVALKDSDPAADARAQGLVDALHRAQFRATASWLAGPAWNTDKTLRHSFLVEWRKIQPSFVPEITEDSDPVFLDRIIDAQFAGSANKQGYLKELRQYGDSGPVWKVRLALGKLEGGSANDAAVMREIESAPEQLAKFKIASFKAYWALIADDVKDKLHHWRDAADANYRRLLAFVELQAGQELVETIEKHLGQVEHLVKGKQAEKATIEQTEVAPAKQLVDDNTRREKAAETAHAESEASVHKLEKGVGKSEGDLEKQAHAVKEATQAAHAAKTRELADALAANDLAKQARRSAELAFVRAQKLIALEGKLSKLGGHASAPEEKVDDQPRKGEPRKGESADQELVAIQHQIREARSQAEAAQAQALRATKQAKAAEETHKKSSAAAQTAQADETAKSASQAAMRVELDKQQKELEAARVQCENAERAVEDAHKQVEAAEKALKLVEHKAEVVENDITTYEREVAIQKTTLDSADTLRAPRAVKYLGTLVRSTADQLNKFDHEAVEKLEEWCKEYGPKARTLALTAPSDFLVAVGSVIKKPRDQKFFKELVEGKRAAADAATLAGDGSAAKPGLGYDAKEVEAHESEVTKAALVVDREAQKAKEKHIRITVGPAKINNTILKEHLLSLSPSGRDQYLSLVSGLDKAALADEKTRQGAIDVLDTKLKVECKIDDATERQKILAVFRVAGAGANYAKLHALVAVTAPSKWTSDEDFGKKALKYALALEDGEYAQVRQDHMVLDAVSVCTTKGEISKLLGSTAAMSPKADLKVNAMTAKSDAEQSPPHWATQLNAELEKLRPARSGNKLYLIGHAAQQAANLYSKAQKPNDANAGTAEHPEAQDFMKKVWAGVVKKSDMQSHYTPLAGALQAGGKVTVDMALDEVSYYSVKSVHFHVDKDDFNKTIDQCYGRELLVEWSNIQDFKDGLARMATPADEQTYKRGFVLDIRGDRKDKIKDAVGAGEAEKTIANLRKKFATSAEHDAEFKAELKAAKYDNVALNRRQMELRSVHEKGEKAGNGLQFNALSAKAATADQARRQLLGEERRANADDRAKVSAKNGDAAHDKQVDHERDEHFEHEHAKELEERAENVELSVEEFEKLRDHIKEAVEVVVAIVIAVAIGAATMGVASAAVGIAIAAKIAAVVATQLAKQAIGMLILGDPFNWRAFVIGTVVEAAGAAAGVGAGTLAAGVDNPFAKAVAKAVLSNTAKSLSKDMLKGATQRTKGEVGFAKMATNWSVAMLASIPTAVITTAVEEGMHKSEIESDKKAHEKSLDGAKDNAKDAHAEAGAKTGDVLTAQQSDVHAHADAALAGMRVDADKSAADHLGTDRAHVTLDNQHVAQANQSVFGARAQMEQARIKLRFDIAHHNTGSIAQDRGTLASAHEHLTAAHTSLTQAKTQLALDRATLAADHAKAADLPEAQAAYQEALDTAKEQDKQLSEAIAQLDEAMKKAKEADEAVEAAEALVQGDEARLAPIEQVANFLDNTIEKSLDPLWDKGVESLTERMSLKEKIERVKPEPKETHEAAHAAPAAPVQVAAAGPGAAPGHA